MIRMTKGTYGLKVNGSVEAMTKHSAPFSLPADREAELVKAGVAAYVEETAEEKAYSNMKMAELRKAAAAYGVDASKCRSKKEVIELIEAAKAKAKAGPSEATEE
ncbi:MAG: hypothetical protein OSJ29_08290 [Alistipes sp.]|nr:hypothetical protein [Alistipes sp.]